MALYREAVLIHLLISAVFHKVHDSNYYQNHSFEVFEMLKKSNKSDSIAQRMDLTPAVDCAIDLADASLPLEEQALCGFHYVINYDPLVYKPT